MLPLLVNQAATFVWIWLIRDVISTASAPPKSLIEQELDFYKQVAKTESSKETPNKVNNVANPEETEAKKDLATARTLPQLR